MTFNKFETAATDSMNVGSDALLYVMAYGHTISVPTIALYFAEKVAVLSIARRETPAAVLADVNKAIDVIAASLRNRAQLDREAEKKAAPATTAAPSNRRPGDRVPVSSLRPAPIIPPAGVANPF